MMPEMSSPLRQEAHSPFLRHHLRRSGSAGSGLHMLTKGSTAAMLGRLLLMSSALAALMLCGAMFLPAKVPGTSMRMRSLYEQMEGGLLPSAGASTLVLYVFSKTDLEYERNLRYFVQHGMWEGDGCEYVIIVQQEDKLFGSAELPQLPPNARYVFHENRCYDWGTIGWAIREGKVDTTAYHHIVFMNSSVRGPFLPNYFPEGLHWSKVFTSRLNDEVKLVGSTISCESAHKGGIFGNEPRHNAHVQSYVMATDQVGLKILEKDGRVLECYEAMSDTIYYSEVGSSAAILAHNFTIDSLMMRYQGMDWRNQSNWDCNAGLNPYAEFAYDGLMLNPLEVLFVKVKDFQMQTDWTSALMAATYDRWQSERDEAGEVNSNVYQDRKASFRLSKAIAMLIRGPACFDHELYRAKSADLAELTDNKELWEHFVSDGQFEGRVFRFTCENPLHDNAIAGALFEEAKVMASQLMKQAFPRGLPQTASS